MSVLRTRVYTEGHVQAEWTASPAPVLRASPGTSVRYVQLKAVYVVLILVVAKANVLKIILPAKLAASVSLDTPQVCELDFMLG